MNNTTLKKIIAREFLFLLSTMLILLFVFIGFLLNNLNYERKIKDTNKDLSLIKFQYQKLIYKPIKIKNKDVLLEYVATANNKKYNSDWNLINSKFPEFKDYDKKVLMDYVATANAEKYNSNFNIINSKFPEFFANQTDIDSLKYFNSAKIKFEKAIIASNSKIISNKEILNFIYKIVLLVFILLFGLRYLYYITRWSLKTLK